jgi:hypothetical protein
MRLYATCPSDRFDQALREFESVTHGDNAAAFDEVNCTVYLKFGNVLSSQQFGTHEQALETYGNICDVLAGGES